FTNPILVDSSDGIIAGHGRLSAAQELGLKTVPVVVLDHLSDRQRKAYILADNQLALNAGWDTDLLRSELQDLAELDFDLSLIGFSDDELADLLPEIEELPPEDADEEAVPEAPEEAVTKPGDVWLLGKHRVMCGDSSDPLNLDKLLCGKTPDLVFTDPPYNIGYQDMGAKFDKIANDKMSDEEFLDFLRSTVMPSEVMYVCCSWQYAHLFKQAMADLGKPAKAMIIWDKVNPAQNLDLYYKQHEIIFYHGPFGGQSTVRGDVWQLKRQRNTLHPTMQPIELIEMALEDHPKRKLVFDGFGGSGSTLIACEKTGRHARLMELDPRYCDVIVKRWQQFTGKTAKLEGTGEPFPADA
ncbi:MAG: site-specific DNA-methyltransferase, partial [Betaproteobacteria bacterium]|nr:site-specific DNA-methyltransferase [Betaproteobacteria bacterium]